MFSVQPLNTAISFVAAKTLGEYAHITYMVFFSNMIVICPGLYAPKFAIFLFFF